jgi:formylglycine-generating enzyme required for sulfatase activity
MGNVGRLLGLALSVLLCGCALGSGARPTPAPEPGMMQIDGGDFTMGRDAGPLNEQPAHEVRLDGYYLDRTEASATDFAAFLNAQGNPDDRYLGTDDLATVVAVADADGRVRFEPRPGQANLPANNVSWYGADAYCRWRGRRLPTEAEWEKGARGTDERRYPWGSAAPAPALARYAQSWPEQRQQVLLPVDSLPGGASPFGLLNMSGNVLEWVQDWYRQNLCDFCNPQGEANLALVRQLTGGRDPQEAEGPAPAPARPDEVPPEQLRQTPPRVNPAGPTAGIFKVLRGGSWQERDPEQLTTTHRFWLDPSQRFPSTGVRCAKDAAAAAARPAPTAQPAQP